MEKKNNIENFFRKRLESEEFYFHESDWQKLEQRLDSSAFATHGKNYGFSGKTMFIGIVLFIGVFMLGWFARGFFLKNESMHIKTQAQETIPTSISDTASINLLKPGIERETTDKQGRDNIDFTVAGTRTNKVISSYNNTPKVEEKKDKEPLSIDESNNASLTATLGNSNYSNPGSNAENMVSGDFISNQQNYIEEKSAGKNIISPNELFIDNSEELFMYKDIQPIDFSDFEKSIELPGFLAPNTHIHINDTKNITEFNSIRDRLMFGVSLASDFNSIGLHQERSLSGKVGAQVYFLVTPNLWFSTGIQYSNKKYNTSAEYYSPGNGYWDRRTNGILPDNIFGMCSVFDIPVMLTYRFYNKQYISLTASAGLSNYLLQDEIYEFEFDQENPGAASGWYTADNSMAPFSFGNVYLGFEWQTGYHTFLVVEPFLQVPFKEVGWGKVNIYSTGVQAKVKYKLGNRR